MPDSKFLTAEEVSDRYRGSISVGTLRNWRSMRIGPTFIKIGKAILNPVDELDSWDQKNTVVLPFATLSRRAVGQWEGKRISQTCLARTYLTLIIANALSFSGLYRM